MRATRSSNPRRGSAQVDLVEDRGRERVRVAEQHAVRVPGQEVLVPAVDARDVGELRARPGRLAVAADLGVGAPVLGVHERAEDGRQFGGERRLAGRLRAEQTDALGGRNHGGEAYCRRRRSLTPKAHKV